MKILGAIPSKLRSTSGSIADALAAVCDEVMVVSQGATVSFKSQKVNVIEAGLDIGLKKARNIIAEYAIAKDFDITITSDDDLKFPQKVLDYILDIMQDTRIASASSCPRVYQNWNKEITSSKPYIVSTHPSQLYAIRTSVLEDIGQYRLETMEDIELGLRMWKYGFPSVRVHTPDDATMTHNPFIARSTKGNEKGGQTENDLKMHLNPSIKYIRDTYPKFVTNCITNAAKPYFYSFRYNWGEIMEVCRKRYGIRIGYYDSKLRIM
jgi:hypothetical protein